MTSPTTEEYDRPSDEPLATSRPALVVAFPVSTALEIPKHGLAVGRDWLSAQGITDAKASREHAMFSRPGGVLHVEDAGSRNGTFVDGQQLAPGSRVALRDGSMVRIGRTLLVYREALEGDLAPSPPIGALVGPYGLRGVAMRLGALALRPARNVLVEGETGTGKELVARAVAERLRPGRPYGPVNVATLPAGVFDAQLFGYVAGAYSGSGKGSRGVFVEYEGGTVFLDEIGELQLELQPKLLRLLDNREVLPVGATRSTLVDVLVIAATNRSLETMVAEGRFRRDLLARLAAAHVELPPLRERAEDAYAIACAIVAQRGEQFDPAQVEVEAVEALMLRAWPGNVRELVAALERIAAVEPPPALRLAAVERALGAGVPSRPGPLTPERVQAALEACSGNQSEAARQLGVSRGQLLRFLRSQGR